MQWENFIENTSTYKEIVSDIASNMLSHAYICISPDTAYAQAFAGVLSKLILCETMQKCGVCRSCRNIDAGVHADVCVFGAETPIKPEDVAEIIPSLAVKPYEGERKVYILANIDMASEEVQNKLLKSIEEPPAHVTFLLTASAENKVLSTIRSRCHALVLAPLSIQELQTYCKSKGLADTEARMVAIGSMGYIGKAQSLLENTSYISFYQTVETIFFTMNASKDILAYATLFSTKEKIQEALTILQILARDAMLVAYQTPQLIQNQHLLPKLQTLVANYQSQAWVHMQEVIYKAQQALAVNTSLSAVVDMLLFAIVEVKYKWKKL